MKTPRFPTPDPSPRSRPTGWPAVRWLALLALLLNGFAARAQVYGAIDIWPANNSFAALAASTRTIYSNLYGNLNLFGTPTLNFMV